MLRFTVLSFAFLLSACASTGPSYHKSDTRTGNQQGFEIGYKKWPRKGYYVLIDQSGGLWQIKKVSSTPNDIRRVNSSQEILYVNPAMNFIGPHFEVASVNSSSGLFDCPTLYQKTDDRKYSPCNSELTESDTVIGIGKSLLALPTLGASLGSARGLDKDKIVDIVEQTRLFDAIKQDLLTKKQLARKEAELERVRAYRRAFKTAKTSAQFTRFINNYSANDPEGLVQQAKYLREIALTQELEEKARQEAVRQASQQHEKERKARIERIATEFRTNLSVGTQTNCGPVLELRGNLVKVYVPVQGYGNEHWVRRDTVYQPTLGCRFRNGQYMPPAL